MNDIVYKTHKMACVMYVICHSQLSPENFHVESNPLPSCFSMLLIVL